MKKKIQKPFDAEAAKNGAVVETMDGNSVRILCYDRAECGDGYPIIALINVGGKESCHSYTSEGKLLRNSSDRHDLVIVEEAKFNVGDWVVRNTNVACPWLITAVTSNRYEVQDTQERKDSLSQITVDNYFRLWALDDAKPGDVLVCEDGDRPFIFKGCIDGAHPGYPTAYCGINCSGEFTSNAGQTWWTDSSVRPATYEKRQQFFNRLEEGGYKWDADSLTLSKVQKRWRGNQNVNVNGYFIDNNSQIINHSGWNIDINYNVFATKKQAKSALAMARISQIMANDERFGGVVTNEEWNYGPWSVILRKDTTLGTSIRYCYEYLAFHTKEQAELFLKENEDLIRDYYMLD